MNVGDIGRRIILNLRTDLTGATNPRILFQRPDGTEGSWDATLGASYRSIQYDTQEGDIDQSGRWRFKGAFELDGFNGSTDSYGEVIVNELF